jgi:DHA1 family inner membrane transport protein
LSATAAPAKPGRSALTLALLSLGLGGFGIGVGEFVPMGLLPEIADSFGTSISQAGHVVSAYALGVVVGAPVLATFGARFPRRGLLIALMLAFAAGNLLSALAPSYGTLVGARLLAGVPHGAFFGVAALVAATAAGPRRRAWAVSRVMLGLSIATVVGVPAATWLGQAIGWRSAFLFVAAIALLTALTMTRALGPEASVRGADVRTELGALRRPQVWLTLSVGAIGLGGLFAVYGYITPTLTERAGMSDAAVPLVLAVWGLGMVGANLLSGPLFDRRLIPSLYLTLIVFIGTLVLFTVVSGSPVGATAGVFLLGIGFALGPGLQTRLMDVAGDAQTLAAALHHGAFNTANALGPWLAGIALAHGAGWTAPAWIGVGLALLGLLLLTASVLVERRQRARAAEPAARA